MYCFLPSSSVKTGTKAGCRAASANSAADQVRDLEGDREGRHRAADPVVAGGDDFAAEAGDARGARWRSRRRRWSGRSGPPGGRAPARRPVPRRGRRPRRRATAASALIASRSCSGVSGALGVSKLGLSRYSRRPPGAGTKPARALDMANIASQKKRILRSERERAENRLLTSTVKTHFRRLESAVEAGDCERDRKPSSATSSRRSTRPCRRAPSTRTPAPARSPKLPAWPLPPPPSSSGRSRRAGRSPEREGQRQLVAVVGAAAAPAARGRPGPPWPARRLATSASRRRPTSCLAA